MRTYIKTAKRCLCTVAALGAICCYAVAQETADTVPPIYDELDEFTVTVKKEIVKSDGANLTYDMEKDDSSKGQSLLDALRKVPMITVDGQDKIYVKGDSNFRIYVNGKEDPMLTANYDKVFKSMPAEAVSKIEVLTEPGARYDAEGTGGIINLITERKQTKEGYTGSVSLTGTNQQFASSLYGRMRYDKVTADANVNYANNALQKQKNMNSSRQTNENSYDAYLQLTDMKQSIWFNYLGGNLNLSWEPTDNDLFTAGGDVTWVDAHIDRISSANSVFGRDGALHSSTLQLIGGGLSNLGASGNASYRRTLGRSGHYLTAAYRFNFGRSHFGLNYDNQVESGPQILMPSETNDNTDLQREHTATLDYENSIADGKHKVEVGAKGVFRRNSSIMQHMSGQNMSALLPDASGNGNIRQIQDVYAAYATYRGTFGNVTAAGGLRYEHTYMGLDFLDLSQANFRRSLDDVVPNASVAYMFGPASSLRAAYQMRISRPSCDQMNPAIFQISQEQAMQGNPDLESESNNTVSLTYSNFGGPVGGNVYLSYSQTNNSIESLTRFSDGMEISTYDNAGRRQRTELGGYLSWGINNKMSVAVNGAVAYVNLSSGDHHLKNHGWTGNYGLNWSYTGPWRMKYTVYGGQSLRNINLQGYWSGWYYYGLSVRKSFLKDDALSLTLNAGNFLQKYSTFKSCTMADGYTNHNTFKNRSWNVGLTLSWNFGHLHEQVKKTDANLDNDDRKSSEKGAGGGIGL